MALWGDSDAFIHVISQIFISLPPGTHELPSAEKKKIEMEQKRVMSLVTSGGGGTNFRLKTSVIEESLFNLGTNNHVLNLEKARFFRLAVKVKVRVRVKFR